MLQLSSLSLFHIRMLKISRGEAGEAVAAPHDVSGDGSELVRFENNELVATQVYDPLDDVWSPFPAPHIEFEDLLSMAAFEDSFFVFGGNLEEVYRVERYHVQQGQWTAIQNVPGEFLYPISTVLGGILIVFDEESELTIMSCVQWVPESDEWVPFQHFDNTPGKTTHDVFEIRDPRANRKIRSFLKDF